MILGPRLAVYLEYGAARMSDGFRVDSPCPKRDELIASLPAIRAAGIQCVVTPTYPGIYATPRDCMAFFGGLLNAAARAGIHIIPGTFAHLIPYERFGPSPADVMDYDHAINPYWMAFGDGWQPLQHMRETCHAVGFTRFYIDAEFCFLNHAESPVMKWPHIRAQVAARMRSCYSDRLPALSWYHPVLSPMYPCDDLLAALSGQEVMAPSPWLGALQGAAAEVIAAHERFGVRCCPGWIHRAKSRDGVSLAEYLDLVSEVGGNGWLFARVDQLRAELGA